MTGLLVFTFVGIFFVMVFAGYKSSRFRDSEERLDSTSKVKKEDKPKKIKGESWWENFWKG